MFLRRSFPNKYKPNRPMPPTPKGVREQATLGGHMSKLTVISYRLIVAGRQGSRRSSCESTAGSLCFPEAGEMGCCRCYRFRKRRM